jgi:tetratricopeptide (TPR) repeat protein
MSAVADRHRQRRIATVAAACVLAGAVAGAARAGAQGASAPRVLVMPFAVEAEQAAPGGAGASYWLGEAAAILLTDELAALGIETFSRDERTAAFERLQLPMSSVLTRATMIRVAELVGASAVLFGEVRVANQLAVRARVIGLDAGRLEPDAADDAPLADMIPLFGRLAGTLAAGTGRPVPSGPRAPAWPLSVDVFENYVKGLVAATPAVQRRFLEAAVKQAPADGRLLTALGEVYALQGEHEKALAIVTAVPAASPFSRKARFAAAMSLVELKRFDGAFKALQTLYGERPSAVLSNALGVIQTRRGATSETGSAAYFFHRAVQEESANADCLFNLGYAYALAGDTQAALFWLREAVRYAAADGDAHLVMSAVLAGTGRTVEAQRELELARLLGTRLEESALALSDKVPAGWERLRTDLDIPPASRVIGSPAEHDQRETAAYHLDRGRRLTEERRDREAINELRRAVYLTPYEDEPHLLLGRLYQRGGRSSEALDEFRIAIWCRDSAAARLALGGALFESGERDAARAEVERALALQPDSVEAKELMRKIGGGGVLTSST